MTSNSRPPIVEKEPKDDQQGPAGQPARVGAHRQFMWGRLLWAVLLMLAVVLVAKLLSPL